MNLLKSLPVIALLGALAVGVTFAHSEDAKDVEVFESSGFWPLVVGKCRLKIVKASDGRFSAWPPSETKTAFVSTWPTAAGEVEFPVTRGDRRVDEILKVTFEKRDGELQPVGYEWKAGIEHKSCGGLEFSSK